MSFFSWLFGQLATTTDKDKAAMTPIPAPPLPTPAHQLSPDTRVLPRGIRLNNPGCIKHSEDSWEGMSSMQDDPKLVRFETPQDGLRALMKILVRYQEKYGLCTVKQIIKRWAPPVENNTNSYETSVAADIGLPPTAILPEFREDGMALVHFSQAITLHENGPPYKGYPLHWFEDSIYAAACASALA